MLPRNLFTLIFGTMLLVTIAIIQAEQTKVPATLDLLSRVHPIRMRSIPTRRPVPIRKPIPIRRPPPTRKPVPTRRPPPTKKPIPTRRPPPTTKPIPTTRPPPTTKPIPTTKLPPTRKPIPTIRVTRKYRKCRRRQKKCTTSGSSLCVRSRNGKLCQRVANKCALRNLNCLYRPRNNWFITELKQCANLKIGERAAKCKD